MRVLVAGCGSIGKRHIRNLKEIGGVEILAVDTREDRREEAAQSGATRVLATLDEGLSECPDAVFVCTPTAHHVPIAQASVDARAHVFVEKPLSHSWDGVPELVAAVEERSLVGAVGYSYRYWPPLRRVRELLRAGAIGRIYSARIEFSEYLPDWHPWEDYRSWFMARAEDGGGALLDESHTIDLVRWLLGEPVAVQGFNGKVSHLEIASDDLAELILQLESGPIVSVHMDLLGRSHRKEAHLLGAEGNLVWDFYANEVRVFTAERGIWVTDPFDCQRNEMFLAEVRAFMAALEGSELPAVDLRDGARTLAVLLAARVSAASGERVRVEASW